MKKFRELLPLALLFAARAPARAALEVRTTALPPCDARNAPYAVQLSAQGGTAPYSWSCGALPAGLSCAPGGQITGTATAANGSYGVTVTVTDAASANAQATLPLAVYSTPAILTPAQLPAGVSGLDYGGFPFQAAGTDGTESWAMTAGTLPTGLYFNGGSSASLAGTPAQTGNFSFTLTLTQGVLSDSRVFSLQIGPRLVPPFWSRRGLAGGVLDVMAISPNYASDRTIVGADSGRAAMYLSRDGGYFWTKLPFTSPGGSVEALALPPTFDGRAGGDHTILAGVGNYDGLVRSTDLGQTWTPIPSASALGFTSVRLIFYDGATPGRVIALASTGFNSVVAASNDLTNWSALASGPFTGLMPSPDFANDRILFASQSGGESSSLLRSTNGGSSFSLLQGGYGKDYGTLAISPRFAADRTLAFVDDGLRVSRDGGDSFAKVGVAGIRGPLAFPSDFNADSHPWIFAVIGGGGSRQLALSTDLGLSFTPTGTTGMPPASFSGNYRLSPTFADDRTVFATGFSGTAMFRSEDGGTTWSSADGGLYLQVFKSVAFATGSPATMFAGTDQGIYYSTNGGASWRRSAAGQGVQWPLTISGFAVSPAFSGDRTVFAYAYEPARNRAYPLRSTDGGVSFSAPAGYYPMTPYLARGQIAISPNFASDHKVFFTAGLSGTSYFYVSYNGGSSFIAQGPGFNGAVSVQNAFGMAVSPAYAGDGTIYLTNAFGAPRTLRTTDGGMLFYDPGASWPAYSWLTPALSPDYSRVAAPAGSNKTIFTGCEVSFDDGASFAALPGEACGNIYPAPDFPSSGRLFSTDSGNNYSSGGRLHRHDGAPATVTSGAAYTELLAPGGASFGGVMDVAFSPNYAVDHTLAVAGGGGLFLSADHGATFTALTGADSFSAELTAVAEDPDNSGRIFLGTATMGAAYSTDEGASATPLAGLPGVPVNDLLATGSPTALLAATSAGVWRRVDFTPSGSWTLSLSGDHLRLRTDPDTGRILAIHTSGATSYSVDAGLSWLSLTAAPAGVRDIVRVPGGALTESPDAPQNTASLWAASATGGAFFSTNGGATWSAAPGGNDYALPSGVGAGWKTVRPLGINPATGAREVAIGHGTLGVYVTRDGGGTWRRASGPGSGLEATSQNVTAFLSTSTPWGSTDLLVGVAGASNGGVYLSADGGEHWTQVNQGFDPSNLSISTLVKTACAGCPVQYYSGTYGGGLYTRTIAVNPPPAFGANSACFGSTACACGSAAGSGPQQGGQPFRICGSAFQNGVAVEFDGVPAAGCSQTGGTVITCAGTPPRVPGAAVIRVRNPDTRSTVLPVAYAYLAGTSRPGNTLRLARGGNDVHFTWNCPGCTAAYPARVYRAQNAAMTSYLEVVTAGAGSTHTATGAYATPRTYFWSIE